MKPKVELVDVCKCYRRPDGSDLQVLQNVSFAVGESEFVSIVGPSGCGKTTLLKVIAGLERPDAGQVLFAGHEAGIKAPIVWQEVRLLPWRNAVENVALGLEIQGCPNCDALDRAQECLATVGLEGFENYYPSQLSGGMAARVAIARAIVVEPEILLLDEAFSSVDYQTKLLLFEEIERIRERTGYTVVHVTHNIRDAVRLSTRVVVLTRRPARVKTVVKVEMTDAPVSATEQHIWDTLRAEVTGSGSPRTGAE